MVRVLNFTGNLYKLESSSGTLLGTIMIPNRWNYYIQMRERVEFAMSEPATVSDCNCAGEQFERTLMIRHALLTKSHGSYPDALMLFGITPEEFERIPGCAFMPGAAYLRSVSL